MILILVPTKENRLWRSCLGAVEVDLGKDKEKEKGGNKGHVNI